MIRIEWENKNDKSINGHGKWFYNTIKNRKMLSLLVKNGNKDYPDFFHKLIKKY